ncbi:hypothetical protein KI387_007433, partial [Taxus chinensis]
RRASMGKTHRYRGVRQRHWGSWVSEIRHPILKKRVWLGTYETAEEAARAYDEAATIMYGDHAKRNLVSHNGKAKANWNSEGTRILSNTIIDKLHKFNVASMALQYTAHKKITGRDSTSSLICLKLDTEKSNQLGIWQKKMDGVKGDSSKWVMKVKIPATKVEDEREEDIVSEMIEELLQPGNTTP